MAKITLKIEIEYESWFNDDREPKTKDEWKSFFESHFMPESSILGVDDGETRDMIAMNSYSVEVTECSTEAENNMKVFSQVHKDCVKT